MTKAIMIQGTTSDAGKSYTVAALCRILKRRGFSPAPFKSQNMALNSFITHDGMEMGRAQVMQAEAAGIEPDVAMNPILLKPTGDTGSQIIVNGQVLDNMSAVDYFAFKHTLKPQIRAAFAKLAETHDIIVIEGAGSPAEINLKSDDIVNMGVAKMFNAPVLIVGDIDRGGVFASLFGTIALLEDDERALVKGTIINKFRGDESLLTPGLEKLEELCGVPCLGVVPYLRLDIDDEDSLSNRIVQFEATPGKIDVAVIRLPHVSNFTDLNPLERFRQVSVRYVDRLTRLGQPDLIVIPGAKNTLFDLEWLKQQGLADAIRACAEAGTIVLGICGGYQILGESIDDPDGMEAGGRAEGLGLLPVSTVFTTEKTQTRVHARTLDFDGPLAQLSNTTLTGYEIHMGSTTLEPGAQPFAIITDAATGAQKPDGCVRGNIMGTYCHGLFEDGTFVNALVSLLCERTGVADEGSPELGFADYKESQYDALADAVEAALDMDALMRIIEEGVCNG